MALSCGAAVGGSGLVSVRRPIPCGFKGAGCGQCTEKKNPTRPAAYKLRLLTIAFVQATSQFCAALVICNRKIGDPRHYILFVSLRNLNI